MTAAQTKGLDGPNADDKAEADYRTRQAEHRAAAAVLCKWTIDETTLFTTPRDATDGLLRQIAGVSVVLEQAHHDADRCNRMPGEESALGSLHPIHMARAFEAIRSLAALALFFAEAQ